MKKSLGYLTLTLALCFTLLFVGCGNTSKTLAKNLDNTITNLIYSVSSLDLADNSILSNISNNNSNNNTSENNINYLYNNSSNQNTQEEYISQTEDTENHNQLTNQIENINNNENLNNTNNNYKLNNRKNRISPHRPSKYNNFKYHNNQYDKQNKNNNYNNDSSIQEPNMSGFNKNRTRFSNETTSNLYPKTLSNNNIENSETTNNQQTKTPYLIVGYSTSEIEDSSNIIEEKITQLMQERSNILLYINDLYKGYVDLNETSIKALNAYINIIKDNTSYLNQNKGIITNQLSQANKLINNDVFSPLINAYIIRTNEAINTRIAKLDSSLLAIQSIADILEANLTNKSPNFNHDSSINELENNNLSTNNNSNLNTKLIQEPIINNPNLNTKLIQEPIINNPNLNYENKDNLLTNNKLNADINTQEVKNNKINNESLNKNEFNNKNTELLSNDKIETNNQPSKPQTVNIKTTDNNIEQINNNKVDSLTSKTTNNKNNQNICNNCANCEECKNCPECNNTNTKNEVSEIKTAETFSSFIDKNYRKNTEKIQKSKALNNGYVINTNESIQNTPYTINN